MRNTDVESNTTLCVILTYYNPRVWTYNWKIKLDITYNNHAYAYASPRREVVIYFHIALYFCSWYEEKLLSIFFAWCYFDEEQFWIIFGIKTMLNSTLVLIYFGRENRLSNPTWRMCRRLHGSTTHFVCVYCYSKLKMLICNF
jgi:hypothetical protein